MTFRVTPWSTNQDRISGASGFTVSSRRTRHIGRRADGSTSGSHVPAADRVRTRTRCPAAARSATRSRATAHSPSGSRTSGAPRCRVPWSPKSAAAHLRAEEKGTTAPADQPGSSRAAARAARVALGEGSTPAMAPTAASASVLLVAPTVSRSANAISPVVMVPVLSRHNTSTRASSSMEASSRAKARRRARATTPTMNERLVSRTSPSGTMATAAATVPRRASSQRSSVTSRRSRSRPAAGGMMRVSHHRMTSTPERSSLSTSVNRRASSARDAAYEPAPIRVAR